MPIQAMFMSTSATRSAGSSGCSAHQAASDSAEPISARASGSVISSPAAPTPSA